MVLYFSVKSWGFFFSFLNLSIKCSPPFNLSILISPSFQYFYPSLSSLFLVVFSFESDHGPIVISCLIEGTRFAEIAEQSKHGEDLNLGLSFDQVSNIMAKAKYQPVLWGYSWEHGSYSSDQVRGQELQQSPRCYNQSSSSPSLSPQCFLPFAPFL